MSGAPIPAPSDPPAIIITGRALPAPAVEGALDVRVIDQRELTDSPTHQLDEILGQVAGLQLFRRSDSASGHPTSQGVTLRALGGTASSRALLILDGVPQTDPFGGWINWPAYDPASLANVRVVRGGGSVDYGPGALAGVIEMTSTTTDSASASLEVGSRESLHGNVYLGERIGNGSLALSAQGGLSDGFIPVTRATRGPVDRASPYREASARAVGIMPVASNVELQASALTFIDTRERGTRFTANRTRGADASLRLIGRGRWQWSATAYGQWRNLRSSFASINDDRTEARRVSLQDSVPGRAMGASIEVRPPLGRAIELRMGADARFADGRSHELYAFTSDAPTRQRIAGGNSQAIGLFSETTWTNGPLALTGGVRLDHWGISNGRLIEQVLASGQTTRDERYPDRSGWMPTGRAAGQLALGGGFDVRTAAYLGWRLPTLNELFRPFRVREDATAANPQLDPERLRGVEAGADFRRGGVAVSVTAFANRLDHAIANVTLGQGPGNFPGVGFVAGTYSQRQNIDSVRVRGIEAFGSITRGPWFFRLDASYSDPRVHAGKVAPALDGLRPAQTPKLVIAGRIAWERKDRAVAIEVRHVGAQFDDDLNQRRLPAATTVGAFVAWPIGKQIQLVGRAENLFNESVVAGIASDGITERATPRTFWLGIRLLEKD